MKNEIDFCLVPEWLAMSSVSSDAVRLYGILNRIGQKRSKVTPWRRDLAKAMNKSVRTIDRFTKELVDIGALVVKERFNGDGIQLSNEYILRQSPPAMGHVAELLDLIEDDETAGQEGATNLTPGGDKSDAPPVADSRNSRSEGATDLTPATNLTPGGDTVVAQIQEQDLKPKTVATESVASEPSESKTERRRRRQELWDTLSAIFDGKNPKLTRTEQSGRGKVVAELLEVGATGAEVRRRLKMFAARFPGASVTPFALVKHWSTLEPPKLSVASDREELPTCKHDILSIAHCDECAAEGRYDQGRAS